MKNRYLGKSGVRVSELCLGTMTFGEADEQSFMHKAGSSEETSFQIMNRALELVQAQPGPTTQVRLTKRGDRAAEGLGRRLAQGLGQALEAHRGV